jgi:hypothetical protein
MLRFIWDHLETIVQFAITFWLASIARNFQITLAVYGTRLEAHREAIRRSRVLWWLEKGDENWVKTMNESMDWHAVNEVFLSPAAAQAFLDIHLWKGLQVQGDVFRGGLEREFKKAQSAQETLKRELLRFRKRTFWELTKDAVRWAPRRLGRILQWWKTRRS